MGRPVRNGPFGLVTKADPFWAGQVYGRSSRIFTLNATPTVGVKLTDWLSIGAGVQVQYIDVALSRAVPAPVGLSAFQTSALLARGATLAQINQLNASIAGLTAVSPLAPSARLTGDDIGVGYTLGATLTPWAGTEIGVGFRSSVHHELEGKLAPALGVVEPVRAPANLLEIVTVGLSQQIGAQWKLVAGYEWTNWSRIKDIPIVNKLDGVVETTLNFRYRDGHFYSPRRDRGARGSRCAPASPTRSRQLPTDPLRQHSGQRPWPKALEAVLVGNGIFELHAYRHHSRLHLVDHVSKGGHRLRRGGDEGRLVRKPGGRAV